MSFPPTQFKLKIQAVAQIALFELSWPGGLPLDAQVAIPSVLLHHYREWRRLYGRFYRTAKIPLAPTNVSSESTDRPDDSQGIRGKAGPGGSFTAAPTDCRKQLVAAELELVHAFHQWLRSPELYDIREQLAQASREAAKTRDHPLIDLFLTFTSADLARLPWEAWEMGSESAPIGNIRIARAPVNIHQNLHQDGSLARQQRSNRNWPRVLVILGDDTGLDLTADLDAINLLEHHSSAYIKTVGWETGKTIDELINDITTAIADPQGWDILFFAGHSHEMQQGGGELAIAPKTTIALKEIKPSMMAAQRHGLQFALFNSCNGLDIAATLIDWGLSQVAIMREPIHNQVAQTFLAQFLESLATHQDVHESLLSATEFLKSKANLTYPSTHLIPTLFRHPQSTLFRIEKKDWKSRLHAWFPTWYEAIALGSIALVSLLPVTQNQLLNRRTLAQAQYRQITGRVTSQTPPPVILVQIDGESLSKDAVQQRYPISQTYIATLIRQLTPYQPDILGVDYVLDVPQVSEAPQLAEAIAEAIAQGTHFVFGSYPEDGKWLTISPQLIPEPGPHVVDGDIRAWPNRVSLPHWYREEPQPFAYALANLKNPQTLLNRRTQRSIPTMLSYNIGQQWFEPIIDFSIPPEQVYAEIPAWTLSDDAHQPMVRKQLDTLPQRVVMLVPGGYPEAGIQFGEDNKPIPLAMKHWYARTPYRAGQQTITGGELQAYRLHHFLTQRLVIPLPDAVLVFLAAAIAKGILVWWTRYWGDAPLTGASRWQWVGWGVAGTAIYGFLSLELYLSPVAILVPIALPTLVVWVYVAPLLFNPRLSP